jgi:Protein of unknown function (DUF2948)
MNQPQRLAAFDAADLDVMSALAQDSVCKVGDIAFVPASGAVALQLNRYKWEDGKRSKSGERVRSVLHFARVKAVRSAGIDQARKQDVLSLLAIRFAETEAPSGEVTLLFSGGATLRLDVECLEAALSDTQAEWSAVAKPRHDA